MLSPFYWETAKLDAVLRLNTQILVNQFLDLNSRVASLVNTVSVP